MSVRRILVTGASGMVGSSLVLSLRGEYEVEGTWCAHPVLLDGVAMHRMDLEDRRSILRAVTRARPDLVVNAAAMTDVDGAERQPERAWALNVEGARLVAEAACDHGSHLVHISTDAVFGGEGGPHREGEPAHPVNVYGQTKRDGEGAVLDAHPGALVIRTTPVGFSPRGDQLSAWILARLRRGDRVPGFVDALFSPIDIDTLARRLLALVAAGATGVVHVAGGSHVSKHDYARSLAIAAGLDPGLVEEGRIGDARFDAPRGADMTLDSSRAAALIGIAPPTLDEVAAAIAGLDRAGRPDEAAGMLAAAMDGEEP